MKNIYTTMRLSAALILLIGLLGCQQVIGEKSEGPQIWVQSAFLLDMSKGGKPVYDLNADVPLPPASMSKLMTELLVIDAIHKGELKWQERVKVSGYAAGVPGARIGLELGEEWTVRELFHAMAIRSANDAAVALAEHVAGSEPAFVDRMNARAKQIGMSDQSHFANATGLSSEDLMAFSTAANEGETLMTARDMGKLAYFLLGTYPEVLEVSSRNSVQLDGKSLFQATNLMLAGKTFAYQGNDGLKTGYTPEAGYCFTGTAVINGKRLITVVMGAETPEERFVATKQLLDYGFGKKRSPHLAVNSIDEQQVVLTPET